MSDSYFFLPLQKSPWLYQLDNILVVILLALKNFWKRPIGWPSYHFNVFCSEDLTLQLDRRDVIFCLNKQYISALLLSFCPLSHQYTSQLCFMTPLFQFSCIMCFISFTSYVVNYLIYFMSGLRLCLYPQANEAASQNSNCVSNNFWISIHDLKSVMRKKKKIQIADMIYSVEW